MYYALKKAVFKLFFGYFWLFYETYAILTKNIESTAKMDPKRLLQAAKEGMANGTIKSLAPLVSLFTFKGSPLTMRDYAPMIPLYKLIRPKRTTVMAGRQISKTWFIAETSILKAGMIPGYNMLIIEPRNEQKTRFHGQTLDPLFRNCSIRDELIDRKGADSVELKTFKNGSSLVLASSFKTPDASRGVSGTCEMYIDELQDINPDFLPVLSAAVDHSIDYGFINTMGTAKTTDDALGQEFEESSQGHWCVKCHHCGKYNIAAQQEQLFKMIGKTGCICAFCGSQLAMRTGFFVHAYKSRMQTHIGYHIPQIVMPFHNEYAHKWAELLRKQTKFTQTKFYNEVLGIPDDESIHILTADNLLKARVQKLDGTLECALKQREYYDYVTVGVDWTGSGSGKSTTVISVLGRMSSIMKTDVLYMIRLKPGMQPEEEIDYVISIASMFRADVVAHDYSGAGNLRQTILNSRHPAWAMRCYPVTYTYKPTAHLVTYITSGARMSYSVDKTRSLAFTMNSIKAGALGLPMFRADDKSAPQYDFLAIVEQRTESLRGADIYLLVRSPALVDDGAHSVNIGFIAMCDMLNAYPSVATDSKYILSMESYEALVGNDDD